MKRKMKLPAAPHRKRHLRQAGSPLRFRKLQGILTKANRTYFRINPFGTNVPLLRSFRLYRQFYLTYPQIWQTVC